MKTISVVLATLVLAACAVRVDPLERPPVGLDRLDLLRGGMTMEQAVRVLGEPTARVELRPGRLGEVYYDLSYVDTIVSPGVVELYFRPTLSEIYIDTELYREY